MKKVEIPTVYCIGNIECRYTPADSGFGPNCDGSDAEACFGGFARQAAIIKESRAAAAAAQRDTVVLHAGDQFSGTVWDTLFTKKGLQIGPDFLNEMGVQAMVLGNHEVR